MLSAGRKVTFVDWLVESYERIRNEGREGLEDTLYEFYIGAWRRFDRFFPDGTSVYDREWDVLIILDACRADLMKAIGPEYDFIENIDTEWSIGSSSPDWLDRTFDSEYSTEIKQTAYVTSNVWSQEYLDSTEFGILDEVWRYDWDDELGTIPARQVTDSAISTWRNRETDGVDRMIVHYMQPHHPFVPRPEVDPGSVNGDEENVWDQFRKGKIEREMIWSAYEENLRYVLDDLALLLDNVDAERVVISADHGNAFGEWGLFCHPSGLPNECLRRVPWCVASSTDQGEYEPAGKAKKDKSRHAVKSKLRDLGYLD